MRTFLGLPILALLALAGCRANPACERQIGLMRSELIALEDKYYALEDKYRQAVGHGSSEFDSCEPAWAQPGVAPAQPTAPPARPSDSQIQIPIDPKDSSRSPSPHANLIAADFPSDGSESVVTFQTPRRFANQPTSSPRDDVLPNESAPADANSRDDESSNPTGVQTRPALGLMIDPAQLTGRDEDGEPGDEGLSLVVQIPSERWSEDGELTLSLLDPNEAGDRQRIGLWRVPAREIIDLIEPSVGGAKTMVPLDLAWNLNSPSHSALKLYARWENPGQEPLESSLPIAIVPHSEDADLQSVGYEEELPIGSGVKADSRSEMNRRDPTPQQAPEWSPDR